MKAVILAAGQGTRIRHLAQGLPKPMLPVGGIPLIEHQLRLLRHYSISEVAINLHYAPEFITDHIGDGRRFGVAVQYFHEETLLGTAGAVKRMEQFLDEPFVVLYGDIYTNLNLERLAAFHRGQTARLGTACAVTLALYQVPNPTECGLVELDADGRVVRFVEKPAPDNVFTNLANAGIMVCEPDILEQIPAETYYDFGLDLFPGLLQSGRVMSGFALKADEWLIDIGTPGGYARAQSQALIAVG